MKLMVLGGGPLHRFRCHPTILSIIDIIGKNNRRLTVPHERTNTW